MVLWSPNDFSCVSSASKQILMSISLSETKQPFGPIVPCNKYFSLTKLLAVVGRVIEFSVKLGAYEAIRRRA